MVGTASYSTNPEGGSNSNLDIALTLDRGSWEARINDRDSGNLTWKYRKTL